MHEFNPKLSAVRSLQVMDQLSHCPVFFSFKEATPVWKVNVQLLVKGLLGIAIGFEIEGFDVITVSYSCSIKSSSEFPIGFLKLQRIKIGGKMARLHEGTNDVHHPGSVTLRVRCVTG
jgi:hypothetical protein